ncbi:hypothetical protein [Hyalangium rubrum]|uniref:Uncharacterized protein n=1 Tax=Hyalangium rubrum TaxID=3103134 RepID=A0ABU5HHD9_9BACT|nr:hypothetical protein [Hyalangium sp. s54d21]MDY7232651.1 hypothetical protein [Hyalangium sp. s54d21]
MDGPSQSVATFLTALQDARTQLTTHRNAFARHGLRVETYFVLGGRPFTVLENETQRVFSGTISLGLLVTGANRREYQLGVDLMWDEQQWTLQTEAWVEAETEGMNFLRGLPERTADTLPQCLEHLRAAIEDLSTFADLVPVSA